MATSGQPAEFESSEPSSNAMDPARLWRGIHDEIVQQIQSGQYPPGSLLPSNAQIQQQWKVSSTTSRRVLAELANGGWAISQGTRGYIATTGHQARYRLGDLIEEAQAPTEYEQAPGTNQHEGAAHPARPARNVPALPRPHHTVPLAGAIAPILTTTVDITVRAEPAPADVAHELNLSGPGTPVLVRRQILADSSGTIPVELWTAYLAYTEAGPLTGPEPFDGTWPQALAAHTGQPITTGTSQIHARHPDPYEAQNLRIAATDIVLTRVTTFFSQDQPLSVTVSVWPASTTRLTAERHPVA